MAGYHNDFADLAAYFEDLAASWRGWQGDRTYESVEHDLRIVANHDGHVRLKVRLWPYPEDWTVETTLRLDAGEQLTQATRDIAASVRGH